MKSNPEYRRLIEQGTEWKFWGPYLAERAWGTVREDYSATGDAWDYFPHDQARSRALSLERGWAGGICDREQRLCFALAFWNGQDPILKERLFGVSGTEGNHGEDVKEYYFYLDSTPTHSYMKMLYKYPQRAYPYADLLNTNRSTRQGRTGVRAVRYRHLRRRPLLRRLHRVCQGRAGRHPDPHPAPSTADRSPPSCICCRRCGFATPGLGLGARGHRAARPQGCLGEEAGRAQSPSGPSMRPWALYTLECEGADDLLFTENETNSERLFGTPNPAPYVKDAFHDYVVDGRAEAVNPDRLGTKAAALYRRHDPCRRIGRDPFAPARKASERGERPIPGLRQDLQLAASGGRRILRGPAAGLTERGRTQYPAPGLRRAAVDASSTITTTWRNGCAAIRRSLRRRRNASRAATMNGGILNTGDIISMPDKWEYPWFASWDLAFHCIASGTARFGVCQGAIAPARPRVVPASQRPDPRLRVGFQQRQSTGAGLVHLASLQDRPETARQGRPRLPGAHVPQADAGFHLVG